MRLKEGVELSSGNSFSKQLERTNPGVSSGIWLTAFIALPAGLLSPAWLRSGDCSGVSAPRALLSAVCGCCGDCTGTSELRSCRLSGKKTGLCGSNLSNIFDLWVLAQFFFSLFLFQLWSNKSFPDLTHIRPKNRNAASTAAPAKLMEGENTPRFLPPGPTPEEKSPCDFRVTLQAKF